jgi:hypothetical protein
MDERGGDSVLSCMVRRKTSARGRILIDSMKAEKVHFQGPYLLLEFVPWPVEFVYDVMRHVNSRPNCTCIHLQ